MESEDDEKAVSKQISDYYKNYSQSRQLPKYLSGSSLSYMPEIVSREEVPGPSLSQHQSVAVENVPSIVIEEEKPQTDPEEGAESKQLSPASSVTSNRRLEWDNGADIGYGNFGKSSTSRQMFKSSSLPTLADLEVRTKKPVISSKTQTSEPSVGSSVEAAGAAVSTSSSSFSLKRTEQEPLLTTTTSSAEPEKQRIPSSSSSSSNFRTTLSYIKDKIGTPDAESTPKEPPGPHYVETPVLGDAASGAPRGKFGRGATRRIKTRRIVRLCQTKPISIECVAVPKVPSGTDKKVQTSFEQYAKSVQTSSTESSEKILEMGPAQSRSANQSVILMEHLEGDSPKTAEHAAQIPRSSSAIIVPTPADSLGALVSRCDSFEYLSGGRGGAEESGGRRGEGDAPSAPATTTTTTNESSSGRSRGDATSQSKSRSEAEMTSSSSRESSSKGVPLLAELISMDTSGDVERNVGILRKLLKSKRYDAATKERYVKKILSRIIKRDSSSSSELFVPKSADAPSSTGRRSGDGPAPKLQQNVPWYPAQVESRQPTTATTNLAVQSFNEEYVPHQQSSGEDPAKNSRKKKKQRSVLTTVNATSNSSNSYDLPVSDEKRRSAKSSRSEENGGNLQSWKEDKTMSERLLEQQQQQQRGQGDHVLKFAMNERQHQINWIDQEINHLSKLKSLLEKRKEVPPTTTTTTVYVVSQQNGDGAPSKRNYVIETELSGGGGSGGSGPSSSGPSTSSGSDRDQFVGDIEVFSDDKTTNIKVKAKKIGDVDVRLQRPATSGVPGGQERASTFPRSRQESPCCPCGRSTRQTMTFRRFPIETLHRHDVPDSQGGSDGRRNVHRTEPSVSGERTRCACGGNYPMESQQSTARSGITCRSKPCKCNCECPKGGATSRTERSDKTTLSSSSANGDRMSQLLAKLAETRRMYGETVHQCRLGCLCHVTQKTDSDRTERTQRSDTKERTTSTGAVIEYSVLSAQKRVCNAATECKLGCRCKERVVPKETYSAATATDETEVRDEGTECRLCCECEEVARRNSIANKTDKSCQCSSTSITSKDHAHQQTDKCRCVDKITQAELDARRKDSDLQSELTQTDRQTTLDEPQQTESEEKVPTLDEGQQTRPEVSDRQEQTEKEDGADDDDDQLQDVQVLEGNVWNPAQRRSGAMAEAVPPLDDLPEEEFEEEYEGDDDSAESLSGSYSSDESSTSFSIAETSTGASYGTCSCCKQQTAFKVLRKKLSEDKQYALCQPCHSQNQRSNWSPRTYSNPAHVCQCYTMVQTTTLNAIKRTMDGLNDVDDDKYCSCVDPRRHRKNTSYCRHCSCRLRNTTRSKHGIAYTLTLEDGTPNGKRRERHRRKDDDKSKRRRHKKKRALEEIRIRIPVSRKKHKDKENNRLRRGSRSSEGGHQHQPSYSVQEYLHQNRPVFVCQAEQRRQTVQVSRSQREQIRDDKKLQFLRNASENQNGHSRRLFSSKEMKDITRKNYKKLPEVQQRLVQQRERQIRQADKVIADTFNRKLQQNCLKGKIDLSADVYVCNL